MIRYLKYLVNCHEELGCKSSIKMIWKTKKYNRESSKYIMELKYKYQRPRPHQIADFYGINLNGVDLDSMKTPSYPSGHATQGYLLGMIYSERYPQYNEEFIRLGEDM